MLVFLVIISIIILILNLLQLRILIDYFRKASLENFIDFSNAYFKGGNK